MLKINKKRLTLFDVSIIIYKLCCSIVHFGHGLMPEIAAVKLANAADNSGGQVRKDPRGATEVVGEINSLII